MEKKLRKEGGKRKEIQRTPEERTKSERWGRVGMAVEEGREGQHGRAGTRGKTGAR